MSRVNVWGIFGKLGDDTGKAFAGRASILLSQIRILAGSEDALDIEILLDPLEEQLYVPSRNSLKQLIETGPRLLSSARIDEGLGSLSALAVRELRFCHEPRKLSAKALMLVIALRY
jgi:hypothetical protein